MFNVLFHSFYPFLCQRIIIVKSFIDTMILHTYYRLFLQQPAYNFALMIKALNQQIPNNFKLLRRKKNRITSNFQQPETHLNQIRTRSLRSSWNNRKTHTKSPLSYNYSFQLSNFRYSESILSSPLRKSTLDIALLYH